MHQKVSISTRRKFEGRGKFLSMMLAFWFLGLLEAIQKLVREISGPHKLAGFSFVTPPVYISWTAVTFIINTFLFIGILRWKKIAVYAFFLLTGVQIILNSTLFHPKMNFSEVFEGIIDIGVVVNLLLWFWAIKRKWHLFT